nr:hypothetical protein [Chlamydiota bacterium]
MSFFQFNPRFVGVDFSSSSLKVAVVRLVKKEWRVEALQEFASLEELEKEVKNGHLATALPTKETLVRPLDLPLKKEKDIRAALEFQMEPLLPYPAEKGIIQYVTAETHSLGSRLTVIAARKDHIQSHLDKHALAPDSVTTVPLALAALTKILPKNSAPLLMMHMGETEGSCVLVQGGTLLAARSFELEKNEIHKAVLAIASSHKSKKCDSILLLSEERKLAEFVEEATGKTVLLPENTISQANISKFALAIGTALASTSENLPNFRAQDIPSPRLWRRVRKPLLTYFVCIA